MSTRSSNTIFIWEIDEDRHHLYCGLCQRGKCGSIERTELATMSYREIFDRVTMLIESHVATEDHWVLEQALRQR